MNNASKTDQSGLAFFTKSPEPILFDLPSLLNREELTEELDQYFLLTNLSCLIFNAAPLSCFVAAGEQPAIVALKQFASEASRSSEFFSQLAINFIALDHCCFANALLVNEEGAALGYLVVGKTIGLDGPAFLQDYSLIQQELLLALEFLRANLQLRLQTAAKIQQRHQTIFDWQMRANLFDIVFTEAPYIIAISDLKNGQHYAANPKFCESMGITTPSELEQIQFVLAPGQEDKYQQIVEDLWRDGFVHSKEIETITRNKRQHILFSAQRCQLNNIDCVLSISIDITERKRAEEALREREALFSAIFNNSPMPIIITRSQDKSVASANPAYYDFSGYRPEEVIGQNAATIFDINKDDPLFKELRNKLQTDGRLENIAFQTRLKDGTLRWILVSCCLVLINREPHTITTFVDVDQRIRAEQALRASEERYKIIADLTGQLHYERDLLSQKIKFIGQIKELFGYETNGLAQYDFACWDDLIHPDDRQAITDELGAKQQTLSPFHAEYRLKQNSGNYLDVEDDGVFLADDQGQAKRMLGVCKDVTTRKKATRELQRRNEELTRFA